MTLVDLSWPLIVGAALTLALVGFAGLHVARLPRVWRGGVRALVAMAER